MDQQVVTLNLKDLVLWTENPRDPIDARVADQTIVDRAVADERDKWDLPKLAREMGDYYDLSELPTVVMHGSKPVVYDGNRRIVLGKIKHGYVSVSDFDPLIIPDFPKQIPCNVCTRGIALQNIYRKHADTGSWQPLERDVFVHKFMGKPKSTFLMMEECTGIIGNNPHLNQRFVKEEIFKPEILEKIGFLLRDGKLLSRYSTEETESILNDISQKIKSKEITTRKNRGKVVEVLDPINQQLVDLRKNVEPQEINSSNLNLNESRKTKQIQTRRTRKKSDVIFGGMLYLNPGDVGNLYRDIADLYKFYCDNRKTLSSLFPCLIRMSLRLLCEAAAKDCNQGLDVYVKSRFQSAKSTLDSDAKTTLSNSNVTETSIMQLLHTGAHNYTASADLSQMLSVSIIIGAILTESHGKVA